MDTVTGTVSAVKRDGKAICVDEVWYSSWDPISGVNRGDDVVFNFVQKGKYNNIKGKVRVSGQSSGGGARPAPKGDFNLGVEMGHAANLAMRMMEQRLEDSDLTVGSDDYIKQFTYDTLAMYDTMKKIKGAVGKKQEAKKAEQEKPKAEVTDEDVFG